MIEFFRVLFHGQANLDSTEGPRVKETARLRKWDTDWK